MHWCLLRGCNLSSKGSAVSSLFAISPSRTGDGGAAPADSSQLINRWPTQTKAAESPRADERPRLIWWQLDDSWSVTGNLSYTHTRVTMNEGHVAFRPIRGDVDVGVERGAFMFVSWMRTPLLFYQFRSLFYLLSPSMFMFEVFFVFEAVSVHNCILSHILRYLTWKAHFS